MNDFRTQATMGQGEIDDLRNIQAGTEGIANLLPAELAGLDRISMNFAWSWLPGGVELFRDLDPRLWDECEQNPRLLLKRIDSLTLQQWAADADYLTRLGEFSVRFDNYLKPSSANANDSVGVAYFCAEYGVHNSLPNYSGGLGILAGD